MNTMGGIMHSTRSIGRYLEALSARRTKDGDKKPPMRPFLTISREAGAGGISVAKKVVELLNAGQHKIPWTVFDKELIEVVRKQHNLSDDVAKYMTESSVNEITDYIGEMLGLHPSSFELVQKTNETIITLARMGKTIIVGRGGHLLTNRLEGGFHVRIVAPVDWRLQRLQENNKLNEKEARTRLKETDNSRRKYVRDNFDSDVEDVLNYDCTINSGQMTLDAAAALIARHIETLY
jgi:cytidylate kinase